MKTISKFLVLFCFTFISVICHGQTASDYIKNGITKQGQEDFRGAIAYYNKAIELDPTNADIYVMRAMCKSKLEDHRGTITDCNQAIKLDSKNSDAYLIRGFAYYNLNFLNDACLDWSKAGELGSAEAYDLIKQFCNN